MKTVIGWRLYALVLVGAGVLLFVIRVFVIPQIDHSVAQSIGASLAQIVDSLIGVTVASLLVSSLVYWVLPAERPAESETILIPPARISDTLRAAAENATMWRYRGHTGRYFRTTILPLLKEVADKHGRYITVQVQILDPDDSNAMSFFAQYRAGVNRHRADYWTIDRARAEIAATAIALAVAESNSPRLQCELLLSRSVSAFTIDVSNSQAVLTRESPSHNALKYPAGSSFYDSICEDLHLSGQQSRRIRATSLSNVAIGTADDVVAVLDTLKLVHKNRAAIAPIALEAIKHPVNPYA